MIITNEKLKLYDWLHVLYVDIVLSQETHLIETKEHVYNARWRGITFIVFQAHQVEESLF